MVKNSLKNSIVNQVNILDIAKEFGIQTDFIGAGNFSHRCKCPSKNHKSGKERTPSLYIDSQNNNYYCFGCQSSSNSLDFYMICADIEFSEALYILKDRINNSEVSYKKELSQDNLSILLDIAYLFRNTMLANPKDLVWINQLMKKTDEYLLEIKKDDIKSISKLLNTLKEKINQRYV